MRRENNLKRAALSLNHSGGGEYNFSYRRLVEMNEAALKRGGGRLRAVAYAELA